MIKKTSLSLFVLMAGLIFMNAINKTSGGHPSSTGAPGEQTCNRSGCHSDASVTKDSPVNTFTFSNPDQTYNLNGSYGISIEINFPGISKFGFEIVAIDSATQKNVGTWWLTEPLRMHIINGESPVNERKYITHTADGTVATSTGKNKWNFRWQAPITNKGTILFYYATNATNKNDKVTGDQLFLSSHKIRFSANSIGLQPIEIKKPSIMLSQNSILVSTGQHKNSSLRILSIDGKEVYQNNNIKDGDLISKMDFSSAQHSIYIYQLSTDDGIFSVKFFL